MNWEKLFEEEREHFRRKARDLIESGSYYDYTIEELAKELHAYSQ